MNQLARQAVAIVKYNGVDVTEPLSEDLLDLSYTDGFSGRLDDLKIIVADPERRWMGPWEPKEGDTIEATIRTINWGGPNEFKTLPLGTFEVDSAGLNGPPDVVTINSLSLPAGTGTRREKRSKAWEKVTLRTIAGDIASRARLRLMFEAGDNPPYGRVDQNEQADMPFLLDLCAREGIAIKVANGRLILFDEVVYEQRKAVTTLEYGRDSIDSYSFNWSTTDAAYRACELTYYNDKEKREIRVTYTPPGAPSTGPVLKIRESVDSEAEALRVARKRLREQNKNYGKASLSMAGDVRMAAGLTINIAGWGRYDGKYIIDQVTHAVGSGGFRTSLEIRKVLGW